MPTFYHGTVQSFVDSIKRDGLKPFPAHSFNGAIANSIKVVIASRVYLSNDPVIAAGFAITKMLYLTAKPHQKITVPFGDIVKDSSLPIVTGNPVVLEIEVPESIDVHVDTRTGDAQTGASNDAFWIRSSLPPSCITDVVTVPEAMIESLSSLGHTPVIRNAVSFNHHATRLGMMR